MMATRLVRSGAAPAVAGVLVGVLVGVLSGCGFGGLQDLPLPGSPDVGPNSYAVTADFDNVLALARQSTVRLDGVVVGRVDQISRVGWKARVTLRLRGDVAVPDDVQARIAQTSLLGEKYVDLLPARGSSAPPLEEGDHITVDHTSRGREVEEVLGALSLLLNGGGVAQLSTITRELDAALADTSSTRSFLAQLDTFVTTLDRNRTVILDSLTSVGRLSRQLNAEHGTVERALRDLSRATQVLAGQRQALEAMLEHLGQFSVRVSGVIRRSGVDLTASLRALQPVLSQLDSAGIDLPRVLETVLSFPFPDEVLNAVKGDYVNLDVLMDLSPLVIAGNLGGGAGPVVPGVPGLPGLPGLPSLPGLPPLAQVPGLPQLPQLPGGPGVTSAPGLRQATSWAGHPARGAPALLEISGLLREAQRRADTAGEAR